MRHCQCARAVGVLAVDALRLDNGERGGEGGERERPSGRGGDDEQQLRNLAAACPPPDLCWTASQGS